MDRSSADASLSLTIIAIVIIMTVGPTLIVLGGVKLQAWLRRRAQRREVEAAPARPAGGTPPDPPVR